MCVSVREESRPTTDASLRIQTISPTSEAHKTKLLNGIIPARQACGRANNIHGPDRQSSAPPCKGRPRQPRWDRQTLMLIYMSHCVMTTGYGIIAFGTLRNGMVRKRLASMDSQQICDSSTAKSRHTTRRGAAIRTTSVDLIAQNAGIPTFLKDGTQHWLNSFTR